MTVPRVGSGGAAAYPGRAARAARLALSIRRLPVAGWCPICGRPTIFFWRDRNPREGLTCPTCRSAGRQRLIARVLLDRWAPSARGLRRLGAVPEAVFLADRLGPIAQAVAQHPAVTVSDFVPGVAPGQRLPGGGTCQDLESLTYGDASFDAVVTEDVLEHVRHLDRALSEIRRVLRPGGAHVFTVPFRFDRRTEVRVDTSGEQDVLLTEPEWHGDPIRGQILAYRTLGYDLFETLEGLGFTTTVRFASFVDRRYGI